MIVYGMNRWKFAKASAFTTTEGAGSVGTKGEGNDPPIKKGLPASPATEDETTAAAMGLSKHMRPAGEGSDGPIKKRLRVRGSQSLRAVRPDENPGPGHGDESRESRGSAQARPRRRRRRRTTRSLGRPSSTP
jgi:hypothetical protein